MYSIIGALVFLVMTCISMLVACGFPLGEFTMGGKYKVLPTQYRIMAVISVIIQLFAISIILQAGGVIPLVFSYKASKYICFFFAIYLSFNTVMNLISRSKKEKYVMTPLALVASISFWITALGMN